MEILTIPSPFDNFIFFQVPYRNGYYLPGKKWFHIIFHCMWQSSHFMLPKYFILFFLSNGEMFRYQISTKKWYYIPIFFVWVFFHKHSRITWLRGKEGISVTPHCHFQLLHIHLDISRVIIAESSPLHIASSRTRTGNLWFPSASR